MLLLSPSQHPSRCFNHKAFKSCRMTMRLQAQAGLASSSQLHHFEGSQLRGPLDSTKEAATLYTHVLCPYAQRAWLVLLEKGVPFNLVNIDLSAKPGWYTKLNPAGLVPAVEWQGHVQTESLDICQWVDKTFEGPSLIPGGTEKAVNDLIKDCSSFSSAGMSFLAGGTGRSWGIGTGQSEQQRSQFDKKLMQLSQAITSSGGPFLAGKTISLADIVYFPFVERFDVAMPEFCNFGLRTQDDAWIDQWLNKMAERQSVQTCSPQSSLLLEAFKKHKSLDFFDFQTYSVTALHPHLKEGGN